MILNIGQVITLKKKAEENHTEVMNQDILNLIDTIVYLAKELNKKSNLQWKE